MYRGVSRFNCVRGRLFFFTVFAPYSYIIKEEQNNILSKEVTFFLSAHYDLVKSFFIRGIFRRGHMLLPLFYIIRGICPCSVQCTVHASEIYILVLHICMRMNYSRTILSRLWSRMSSPWRVYKRNLFPLSWRDD